METAATQEVDVNKKAKVLVRLGLYYELIRRDLILSDFRYGSNPPTAKGRGGGGGAAARHMLHVWLEKWRG